MERRTPGLLEYPAQQNEDWETCCRIEPTIPLDIHLCRHSRPSPENSPALVLVELRCWNFYRKKIVNKGYRDRLIRFDIFIKIGQEKSLKNYIEYRGVLDKKNLISFYYSVKARNYLLRTKWFHKFNVNICSPRAKHISRYKLFSS